MQIHHQHRTYVSSLFALSSRPGLIGRDTTGRSTIIKSVVTVYLLGASMDKLLYQSISRISTSLVTHDKNEVALLV